MKKLTLQLDALRVESFSAMEAPQAREFFATRPEVCDPFTLPPRCNTEA